MEQFGKLCFSLITIVVLALISGFVFHTFWGWFIVPAFGIQQITFVQAIGIAFFTNYLKVSLGKKNDEDFTSEKALQTSVILSLLVLGLGWLITLFM